MSAIQSAQTDMYGRVVEKREPSYLTAGKGIRSWLFTLDHKRIGILYMISVLFFFAVGGTFAELVRTELIAPGPTLPVNVQVANASGEGTHHEWVFPAGKSEKELPGNTDTTEWNNYNQLFTLHGAIMTFLFIIPAIPGILGNFVLPLMLGAKDMAFPRINLLSWYCYMGGACLFLWVLGGGIVAHIFGVNPADHWWISNGLDTGWTFYTPYSTRTDTGVTLATAGTFILGFSSILSGVNFIASIHMLRAPGQGWLKLPLMLWGLYSVSLLQILATPVLAITLLLLICERTLGIGIFDPALGGDPILYQHFFWFYSHPAVYMMVLPAFGVISELISVHSRKHIFGYGFIAASSIAISFLGFLVWGHHMFVSGESPMAAAIFSLITFGISIPSGIKVFNWLATMYKGSIRLDTPMLYAMGFIWLFSIGGLTGVFVATLSIDVDLTDTYFVVSHFHYVMVGSMLFAFLGGMYHWFPKIFGKMYSERWAKIAAALVFIGFNGTFFIQLVMGSQGMPRRYADYPDQFWPYHLTSTIGAYILAVGLITVLGTWIWAMINGRQAPANPWGANSLEWQTVSPPPHHNFEHVPVADDPYNYDPWRYDEALDGYVTTLPAEKPAPVEKPTPAPAQPVGE